MAKVRFWALAGLTVGIIGIAAEPSDTVSFNRDIRPIMSNTCFRCHGPDASSRMAGLRLDIREQALRAAKQGTPIVPGDPDHSEIIKRIFEKNTARIMPPAFAHKELTEAQKDTIRRWVAQGAKYEGHWAYQPVARPAVPAVATVRNPIDAFIQARLAKEGLSPSPKADRRTLIRRVSLDLTGLAPRPAEVAAFIADSSPDAYEKLVDRLLASPEYAEQRTAHWLDAVRYADTAGFHSDGTRPVWPYRDYVLRAFLHNKPFDEFTREQLAGDLLPSATIEQKVAGAYNRLNRTSAEGGLQPKEYLAKYGADRVRDLGTVWLGTTMGCAECHDHKFDPVLTKDFYSMKAFFADIKEDALLQDTGPTAFSPKMPVYAPGQKEEIDALRKQIEDMKADLDRRSDAMAEARIQWEKETLARYDSGDLTWKFFIPAEVSASTASLTIQKGPIQEDPRSFRDSVATRSLGPGMISVGGPNPDNETYTVTLKPGAGKWTGVGIEVGTDQSLPGANIARGSDRFVLTEVDAELDEGGQRSPAKLPFLLAHSNIAPVAGLSAMAVIDRDPKTGWGVVGNSRSPFLMLRFAEPVNTSAEGGIVLHLRHDSDYRRATMGRFRVALSSGEYSWPDVGVGTRPARTGAAANDRPESGATMTLPPLPAHRGLPDNVVSALRAADSGRSDEQKKLIREYFSYSNAVLLAKRLEIARLETKAVLLQAAVPEVMITESVEPAETRVLGRGNWMDDSGKIVDPAIPEFLGKLETDGHRATRLDLANWLVSSSNPLTSRVFVNRMWRQFFGTGLSKNLEDLGSQGELPTHPELLDWLASEFMKPEFDAAGTHPWDVKHLLRTIVTSDTYQQSSLSSPELEKRDPDNRLLARQSRFRVDAESVHDVALEISGLLVEKFGGPTVRPYQPDGYLAALNFPKRDYSASRGGDLYRRAVYTHWQRTFLHPSLANFDAPSREECTVNRVNSNTPLQALDLLNDPIFVEAARAFAGNILERGGKTLNARLEWAFQHSLARRPDNDELKVLSDLHREALTHFQADPSAAAGLIKIGESPIPRDIKPADLAAMTSVARVILNLHEVITRD